MDAAHARRHEDGELEKLTEDGVPRRNRLDLITPAERAIFDAIAAVEALHADVRLTEAQTLLDRARHLVSDAIEDRE